MRIFKIKRDKTTQGDRAAKSIATGILKIQNRFADMLRRMTKRWGQKHQWIFLYSVCAVFGTLSILAIVQPFKTLDATKVIIIKSIVVPKSIYKDNKAFTITKKELEQVREYKAKHPNLSKTRPGLYDSLSLIEEIYNSHQK